MAEEKKIERKHKRWHQKWWGVLFLIIIAILVLYTADFIYQFFAIVEAQNQANSQNFGISQLNQPTVDIRSIVENADDPFWGPKDAKIVIVEFSDFQCPYCEEAYTIMKKIRQEYQNSVKFIYRDFPNLLNHPSALDAALAGRCAAEQNKFWEMHDLMFENQSNLSTDNLKLMAQGAGLDSAQFDQCLDSQKYVTNIQSDLQDGLNFDLNGTPTFFINGAKVVGVIPYDSLKLAIDKLAQSNNQGNIQENINVNSDTQDVTKCSTCK